MTHGASKDGVAPASLKFLARATACMSLNHLLAFQQVQLHREPKRQFLFPEVVPEGGFCPHLLGMLGAFSQARRLTEVGRLRQARRGG